jgi:hypothetical protein
MVYNYISPLCPLGLECEGNESSLFLFPGGFQAGNRGISGREQGDFRQGIGGFKRGNRGISGRE